MDVSIIIVNYNTKVLTSDCIRSIVDKVTDVDYEIILVDNASTDGSKELFEKDKRITYIYSEHNGGFGYGNNLGMKMAMGKYFFLLNSDTILVNNAVKEFFDYAESNNSKCVYGCYLQNKEGGYNQSFFYFPAFSIIDFMKRILHLKKHLDVDNSEKQVEAITGADMFFHREMFDKTGGFDENIFMYGEEGEWQYRLLNKGYHAFIIPQPKVIHLEGQSSKPSIKKKAVQLKGHFYILKKHMNRFTYYLARCYYVINLTLRNLTNLFNPEYKSLWKVIYS